MAEKKETKSRLGNGKETCLYPSGILIMFSMDQFHPIQFKEDQDQNIRTGG